MLFFFEHHGMRDSGLFRVNRMRNQSFPAHLHRACELLYLHAGSVELQVETRRYRMEPGHIAFVFGNQVHSFLSQTSSDLTVVLFSPEMISDFFATNRDRIPQNCVMEIPGELDFASMHSIYAQKSALYSICDRMLASTEMIPAEHNLQVATLQRILAYIDLHFCESCSLKDVAISLQYDYVYLSKLFTRLTGVHFTAYLNNYRIAQACALLQNGGVTVSEAAARCGYATMRTFHRNFQAVMGCSPRTYLAHGGKKNALPAENPSAEPTKMAIDFEFPASVQ